MSNTFFGCYQYDGFNLPLHLACVMYERVTGWEWVRFFSSGTDILHFADFPYYLIYTATWMRSPSLYSVSMSPENLCHVRHSSRAITWSRYWMLQYRFALPSLLHLLDSLSLSLLFASIQNQSISEGAILKSPTGRNFPLFTWKNIKLWNTIYPCKQSLTRSVGTAYSCNFCLIYRLLVGKFE